MLLYSSVHTIYKHEDKYQKKNRESCLPMSLTDSCLDPVFSFISIRRWFCSSHSFRSFIFLFCCFFFSLLLCSLACYKKACIRLTRVIALEYVHTKIKLKKNDYISIFISPIAGHCSQQQQKQQQHHIYHIA